MIYEDTFPGNFREFLIELVSGKFRKIAYFGGVRSIDRMIETAVCFYNECTVISDKIGFIVSLILISVAHLYLNCTIVHPLAVFINLDVAL